MSTKVVNLTFDEDSVQLGTHRSSIRSNPLLNRKKAVVGHAPKPVYKLPSDQDPHYTYGNAGAKAFISTDSAETAACITGWEVHVPSSKKEVQRPTDHLRLNRLALKQRLVTSRDQTQFVREHREIRCKPKPRVTRNSMKHSSGAQTARELRSFDDEITDTDKRAATTDDITFGRPPPRAPTPLDEVMQHNFQKKWLKEQSEHQKHSQKKAAAKRRAVHEKQRRRLKQLLEVSHERQAKTEEHRKIESGEVVAEKKRMFKLKRFEKIGPSKEIDESISPRFSPKK